MLDKYRFLKQCLADWVPDVDASILVIGCGINDARVLSSLGYRDVCLTDLSDRGKAGEVYGYRWQREDAHNLTFADDSFDYCLVHAALHHCESPHRALLELYRVARRGVVVSEARDSFVCRCAARLGVTEQYEVSGVKAHEGKSGGVNNSHIPNFIYRWTEREVKKLVWCYRPDLIPRFEFRYALFAGSLIRWSAKPGFSGWLGRRAAQGASLIGKLIPRQQNLFAFLVEKPSVPEGLQPWLGLEDGRVVFADGPKA